MHASSRRPHDQGDTFFSFLQRINNEDEIQIQNIKISYSSKSLSTKKVASTSRRAHDQGEAFFSFLQKINNEDEIKIQNIKLNYSSKSLSTKKVASTYIDDLNYDRNDKTRKTSTELDRPQAWSVTGYLTLHKFIKEQIPYLLRRRIAKNNVNHFAYVHHAKSSTAGRNQAHLSGCDLHSSQFTIDHITQTKTNKSLKLDPVSQDCESSHLLVDI